MEYAARMKNFELRRDRFEAFSAYDNPLINLSFDLDLPDFRPYCKAQQLPPFHFFLYCLLTSVKSIDNFMYRIHEGEVIKIDEFYGSYTVINADHNLNYANFTISEDLREFIARSVAAGEVAKASRALINTGAGMSPRQQRNQVYVTCLPWFDLSAIEHPIYRTSASDIPLIVWGKFADGAAGRMRLPFSVQAHHGFVDGFHIHLLAQKLASRIEELIA
jgi:chloramphenicol O-acetyltransferase type A